MPRLGRAALALVGALALLGAACGDDGGAPATKVKVGEIRDAVAAVERQLGGPQQYVEVNATETEVNVFVLRDGQDLAFVVRDGAVEAPPSGESYRGPTFTADRLDFEDGVLDLVTKELPDSRIGAFSAVANASGGVDYIVSVQARGTEMRVLVGPDGSVLGVD